MSPPADPPHEPQVERAVLACYLLSPYLFDLHPTEPEHYHAGPHRAIHAALCHLRDEGVAIDLRTLEARLHEAGELQAVGGLSFLAALDLELPDLGGIGRYVDILEDRKLRRRMLVEARRLDASARNGVPAAETLERHLVAMARVSEGAIRSECVALAEILADVVPRVVEMRAGETLGVETGLAALDQLTSGMDPGQVWVWAGRPGMGKTAVCHSVLRNQTYAGHGTLLFSLEMTAREVALRLLAAEVGVPSRSIGHGHTTAVQREQIKAARARLDALPIKILDSGRVTIGHLTNVARAMHARTGFRVLWIDHASHVSGPRSENKNLEMQEIFLALKALAKELSITVCVLNQLNRECEKRSDKRPMPSDLRDSGAVEQVADVLVFPFRPHHYEKAATPDLMQLIVAKQRDGAIGLAPAKFIRETCLVRGYDYGEPLPPDAFGTR